MKRKAHGLTYLLLLGGLVASSCSFSLPSATLSSSTSSSLSQSVTSDSTLGNSGSSSAFSTDSASTSSNVQTTSSSSSSSAPSSSSSSSSASSSSSKTSSGSSSSKSDGYYRIEPVTTGGSTLNVYNIDGTVNRTLTKGSWYIEPEDVALYYQGFGTVPDNYQANDSSSYSDYLATYGKSARLYTQDYTRNYGYTTDFPTLNQYRYFELDIGGDSTNPSYNNGSRISRGAWRLVVVYQGCVQYGNTHPVIFYTKNHYVDFQEFYNYAGGWGHLFDGEPNTYNGVTTYPQGNAYVAPTTITLPAA